ncbi:MAG TPA: hypothetical protein VLM85_22900 [Polyangiaceae bacterium]|nr:hypothetical protein [Polyangiaceae bacterium]
MSDRTFLLQDWVTVRSNLSSANPLVQSQEGWLDMSGFADAAFWVDVAEVTPPGGVSTNYLQLFLETSPTCDEIANPASITQSWFQPTTGALRLGTAAPFILAAPTPFVVNSVRSASTVSLSRYLRWRVVPSAAGAWDLTFRIRVVANRSGFFVPTDLAGCVLWLRPDLGTALNGTATGVATWNDQSGTGDPNKNLTAGSVNPTLTASDASYAGRATIQIANSPSSFFQNTTTWATTLSQPHTWVLVGHRNQNNATNYFMDGNAGGFAATVIGTSAAQITMNAGGSVTTTGTGHDWITPSAFLGEFNGASSKLYFNSFTNLTQSGNAGTVNFNQLCLGAHSQGFGGGSPWAGTIAEVIAFSGLLPTSAKARLRSYLNARYGLSIT